MVYFKSNSFPQRKSDTHHSLPTDIFVISVPPMEKTISFLPRPQFLQCHSIPIQSSPPLFTEYRPVTWSTFYDSHHVPLFPELTYSLYISLSPRATKKSSKFRNYSHFYRYWQDSIPSRCLNLTTEIRITRLTMGVSRLNPKGSVKEEQNPVFPFSPLVLNPQGLIPHSGWLENPGTLERWNTPSLSPSLLFWNSFRISPTR